MIPNKHDSWYQLDQRYWNEHLEIPVPAHHELGEELDERQSKLRELLSKLRKLLSELREFLDELLGEQREARFPAFFQRFFDPVSLKCMCIPHGLHRDLKRMEFVASMRQ